MPNPDLQAQHKYRLQVCDLLTGRQLAYNLDAIITSVLRGINDAGGTLAATIPLREQNDTVNVKSILTTRKTVIWIWRDEVPIWGGILWQVTPDVTNETVQIQCQGFMSYLAHVELWSDQTFTNVDQMDIARALLDYAQGLPNVLINYANLSTAGTVLDTGGSNIGLTYSTLTSGVLRTRAPADGYQGSQQPKIMDLLTNLGNVIDGFQWYEDITWTPGSTAQPVPFVQFAYPQFKRSIPLTLRMPGTVITYEAPVDGTNSVNGYVAIGATNTTTNNTFRAIRTNQAELAAGFPVLRGDSGSNYTDVTNAATLDAHAVEDIATVAGSSVAYIVTAIGDVFGKFNLGDSLSTSLLSAWDKVAFEGQLQVIQWELIPGTTSQQEQLKLTMAPIRSI